MSTTSELTRKNLEQFESNPKLPTPSQDPLLKFTLGDKKTRLSEAQSTSDFTGNASEMQLDESPFSSDFFNNKLLGFDMGPVDDSAFNPTSINDPFNSNIDFEKIRADSQSAMSKIGAMGVQFIGKTAVGTVGNIVGGFYGIGAAIAQGDSDYIFDNSVYRTLDEANESIEAKNTLFVNNKQNLGVNWKTAKELKDAFEFITQAVLAEAIMQTAGNAIGGAGLASFTGRAGRYINKIDDLVRSLDNIKDAAAFEKYALQLGTTVERLASARRNIDAFKATTKLARTMMTTTGYEASLEARNNSDMFKHNMINKLDNYLKNSGMSEEEQDAYRRDYMARMEQDASNVGLSSFLFNTAVLSVSNVIQFPGIFGSKYINASQMNKVQRAGLGQVEKATMNRFLKGSLDVGRILKSPVTEFFEETGQGVISQSTQNYYETMLANDTNVHTLNPLARNFAKSLAAGIEETYTTKEGLHEGIIGAIVGGIGLPGFKRVGGKAKFDWQGGVVGSYKDIQAKKKYTEDVINSINDSKLSEGLTFNKDNAIRASVDTAREDLAVEMNNPIEFESVQTNKTFRYVNDRLKRGMKDQIDEDIAELTEMANNDLDKYKKEFGKNETFTKEDALEEIEAFKEKVDIYTQAYNKVNRAFQFGNYSVDSTVHNKFSEVLTHSLAMSKIWGDQLNTAKQRLYEANSGQFTPQELDAWAETHLSVAIAGLRIEEFIDEKQAAKDAKNQEDIAKINKQIKELTDNNTDNVNDAKIAQLKETIEKKENEKFQFNKSSAGRALKAIEKQKIKEANERLQKSVSEASKQLGKKMPKNLTTTEMEKYIGMKAAIVANLNKTEHTNYELDREVYDDNGMNLMDIINEYNDRFKTAMEIAASLYGFRDNPQKAYGKILTAELHANLNNVDNKATHLLLLVVTNDAETDEAKLLATELENDLELLKEKAKEYKDTLTPESKKIVDDIIKKGDAVLARYKKAITNKKEIATQQEEAGKTEETEEAEEATLEEALGELRSKIPKSEVETEDQTDEDVADDPDAVAADKKNNRLVIKDRDSKKQPVLGNIMPNSKDRYNLEEAIENGKIKNKAATTLTLQDKELDPVFNKSLADALKKANVSIESYNKGKAKVEKSPKILLKENEKLDADVLAFIRFAPIVQRIYDKVAKKEGKKYTFEITETDEVAYEQYLFAADDIVNIGAREKENNDKYQAELTELKATRARIIEEQSALKSEKEFTKSEIDKVYDEKEEILYLKYKASFNNSYTLTNMRKALLNNFYNNSENELKLKVHNVDQGNIENFEFDLGENAKKAVIERPVSELGYTADNMTMDDILYGDSNGLYHRIDGKLVRDIGGHPLQNMRAKAQSGKIYFMYKDKSGRTIPIQMNTATVTKEDFQTVYKVLKDYLLTADKKNFRVTKSGIPFIDNRNFTMTRFLEFYLRNKENAADSPIYIRNTFALINKSKKLDEGEIMLQIFTGAVNASQSTYTFPAYDGTNRKEILEILAANEQSLADSIIGQRRPINKSMFLLEKDKRVEGASGKKAVANIVKDALSYLLENKIISHTFDVANNFDKIYERDANRPRHIVLSRADIDDVDNTKLDIKKDTLADALKDLRSKLGLKASKSDKEYEVNEADLTSNLIRSLRSSLNVQFRNAEKKKEKLSMGEAIKIALKNYTTKQTDLIKQVAADHPFYISKNANHDTVFEKVKGDRPLDTMLRYFYRLESELNKSKKFIKQVTANRKNMNDHYVITEALKYPGIGSTVSLNRLNAKDDKESVTSQIQSQEQLDSLIYFFETLHALTEQDRYVDITYTKDYKAAKRPHSVKYNDPTNRPGKLEQRHVGTQLKSIHFLEQPELSFRKDGTPYLSKGLIVGNFGRVKEDGTLGNDRIILLAKDGALPDKLTTVAQSIEIPTTLYNKKTLEFSDVFVDIIKNSTKKATAYKDMRGQIEGILAKFGDANEGKSKYTRKTKGGRETAGQGTLDIDIVSAEDIASANGVEVKKVDKKEDSTVDDTGTITLDDLKLDTSISIAMDAIKDAITEETIDDEIEQEILEYFGDIGIANGVDMALVLDYFTKTKKFITSKQSDAIGEIWNKHNENDKIQKCK